MTIARIRIIHCEIDIELAKSRFIQCAIADPGRANFHDDWTTQTSKELKELLNRDYEAPQLAVPTLSVNTSNGYRPGIDEIVSFAKS